MASSRSGLLWRSRPLVFPVALGHALGDLSVAFGCGVLVAHCGGGCGVAEAVHQLGEGGAGLGGQDGTGVAQVVEAQVWAAGGLAGGVVPAADG